HPVDLRGQAPAHLLPTRRQVETEDPLLSADRQAPAVGAEGVRLAVTDLVVNDPPAVGHAPEAQHLSYLEAEEELLVGAEVQTFSHDRPRGDAANLPVVGDRADADGPRGVDAGVVP